MSQCHKKYLQNKLCQWERNRVFLWSQTIQLTITRRPISVKYQNELSGLRNLETAISYSSQNEKKQQHLGYNQEISVHKLRFSLIININNGIYNGRDKALSLNRLLNTKHGAYWNSLDESCACVNYHKQSLQ